MVDLTPSRTMRILNDAYNNNCQYECNNKSCLYNEGVGLVANETTKSWNRVSHSEKVSHVYYTFGFVRKRFRRNHPAKRTPARPPTLTSRARSAQICVSTYSSKLGSASFASFASESCQ